MNWLELKQYVENEMSSENTWSADSKQAFLDVLDKMNELEKETTFFAYSDEDGYELIRDKSQEGVMVWTHKQENNFVLLKVKKSAVAYQDEETSSYDCDPSGIEVIEKLK